MHHTEKAAQQTGAMSSNTDTLQQHTNHQSTTNTLTHTQANELANSSNVADPVAPANAIESLESNEKVQEIIQSLTGDAINRIISAIEQGKFSQPQIEMSVQLIATEEKSLPICHMPGDNRPYIRAEVNRIQCHPLLDSGAMICVVGYEHESELKKFNSRIEPCSITVTTVNQENHEITGVMWLTYKVGRRTAKLPTIVMKSHRSYFIAGINFWQAFNILCTWGDSDEEIKPVKPWNDTVRLQPSANGNEVATMTADQTQNLMNPNNGMKHTNIGMLSVASRVKHGNGPGKMKTLPKHGSANYHPVRAKLLTPRGPVVTRFEHGGVSANDGGTLQQKDIRSDIVTTHKKIQPVESHENSFTATSLIRQMLRNMPVRTCEIQEIAIQPAIRTATGSDDAYEDVRREKHTCVTEPHTLTEEQQRVLDEVMAEFPYTPETGPLNCTPIYSQNINTGTAPPEMRKQYPMSPYVLMEVEKEIQTLIERDIIEPIDFSPWRWPILWVKKKDGGGRICLDARGLNKVTIRDAYPTLKVDTILQNLPRAKYISCLDMTQAFHQIAIIPEDRNKTAFAVGHRFYRYKRATMGFTNSPADLAKVLDKIFGDLIPQVYHYVDDFIILSATFKEHIKLLREVARRLKEAHLTVSRKKSLFCHKKITFLGYVLADDGLTPNPERLTPIMEYKRPSTIKELRRLIGLIGWYRRFLPYAAEILAPLTDLTRGDNKQKIIWNNEAERAFEKIKEALMSAPILASPDYGLPYKIYTDASLVAGAAVLTQVQDGVERVIAYHSAKFSPTQRNYSATERECLAVLTGVEKFRPFIDGVEFTVVTDHASLKWLQNLKEPHGKLARWAVRLQAFNIKFEHRPGREMIVPDALSRSVDLIEVEKDTETTDKWYNSMHQFASTGKAEKYKIVDGLLYHMGRFDIRTGDRRWSLCVPQEKIAEVLAEQHDSTHFGYWKTLRLIQRLYYWPNLHKTVYDYVQKCAPCKLIKPSNENTRVPTGDYIDPKTVGRILSVDLVGPLPASKIHKHMWIIVAVDVFSKYTFAKACTRATAQVIAEFLEKEIFYKFDTPEILISDNGTQFTSKVFKQFISEHRIRHLLVPVYHPQANPVEATNKCVKTLLRAELLRRADHTDWSSVLQRAVMNLNTAPRMPTGQSPHFIVYGREKNRTGDEHRIIGDQNDISSSPTEQEEIRGVIYEQAAEEQRAAFEKNKRHYNLRAKARTFKSGDMVYVREMIQSSAGESITKKLAPVKKLAYVKEKVSGANDIYVLTDGHGKDIGKYHANEIFTK